MTTALVFLDIETTSLDLERRLPWEIAMIRVPRDAESTSIRMFIDEPDLADADAKSLQIGQFFDRHPQANGSASSIAHAADVAHVIFDSLALADSVKRSEAIAVGASAEMDLYTEQAAMQIVEKWTRGAVIVGANPSFDTLTLEKRMRFWNQCPSWHHRLIDVESMYAGHTGGLSEKGTLDGLDTVARGLDVEVDESVAHTAMGDALLAKAVFEAMLGTRS